MIFFVLGVACLIRRLYKKRTRVLFPHGFPKAFLPPRPVRPFRSSPPLALSAPFLWCSPFAVSWLRAFFVSWGRGGTGSYTKRLGRFCLVKGPLPLAVDKIGVLYSSRLRWCRLSLCVAGLIGSRSRPGLFSADLIKKGDVTPFFDFGYR